MIPNESEQLQRGVATVLRLMFGLALSRRGCCWDMPTTATRQSLTKAWSSYAKNVIELLADATSPCLFTAKGLLQFGFALDDLRH